MTYTLLAAKLINSAIDLIALAELCSQDELDSIIANLSSITCELQEEQDLLNAMIKYIEYKSRK